MDDREAFISTRVVTAYRIKEGLTSRGALDDIFADLQVGQRLLTNRKIISNGEICEEKHNIS